MKVASAREVGGTCEISATRCSKNSLKTSDLTRTARLGIKLICNGRISLDNHTRRALAYRYEVFLGRGELGAIAVKIVEHGDLRGKMTDDADEGAQERRGPHRAAAGRPQWP